MNQETFDQPKLNGSKPLTPKQRRFLAAYRECGSIRRAAELAKVSRNTHHTVWIRDPGYAKAFDDATEEAVDRLEEEARRRAVEGVAKVKYHNGRPIINPDTGKPVVKHEYSDPLLMFLLKGARPAKYRDQHRQIDVRGQVEHRRTLTLEELNLPPGSLDVIRQALGAIRSRSNLDVIDAQPALPVPSVGQQP